MWKPQEKFFQCCWPWRWRSPFWAAWAVPQMRRLNLDPSLQKMSSTKSSRTAFMTETQATIPRMDSIPPCMMGQVPIWSYTKAETGAALLKKSPTWKGWGLQLSGFPLHTKTGIRKSLIIRRMAVMTAGPAFMAIMSETISLPTSTSAR